MGIATEAEVGGSGMPEAIYYAATDFFSCAGVAFTMYPMLSVGAMNIMKNFMPAGKVKGHNPGKNAFRRMGRNNVSYRT